MSAISFKQALDGSSAEKGKYLKSLRFTHRNLERVVREVQRHMIPCAGLSVTVVVGPAGVGKSTFAELETESLLKLYDVEVREDPGSIPVVLSEVDAADGKEINWQVFYQHICQDLHALCPDLPASGIDANGRVVDVVKSSRMMFERALRNRKVRHLILDEAVHFTDSATDPLQYGNLLKSLGNRANMNLLLVGAYGSEKLVRSSSQLARRIAIVHFPRYYRTQEDFDAFTQFIKEFEAHIPLPFKIDLKKFIIPLFDAHNGRPGHAAQALIRAVCACADEGSERWKDEYMWNAFPSDEAYDIITMETLDGEEAVKPYLTSPHPRIYPSEDAMLAKLIAQKAKNRSDSRMGVAR